MGRKPGDGREDGGADGRLAIVPRSGEERSKSLYLYCVCVVRVCIRKNRVATAVFSIIIVPAMTLSHSANQLHATECNVREANVLFI